MKIYLKEGEEELEKYIKKLGFKGKNSKEKYVFIEHYLLHKNIDNEPKYCELMAYKIILKLDQFAHWLSAGRTRNLELNKIVLSKNLTYDEKIKQVNDLYESTYQWIDSD